MESIYVYSVYVYSVYIYTLICIKWITNKNLLYKKIKFKNSKKEKYFSPLLLCITNSALPPTLISFSCRGSCECFSICDSSFFFKSQCFCDVSPPPVNISIYSF